MIDRPKVAYFPPGTTKATILNYNGKSLDKYLIRFKTKESMLDNTYTADAEFTRDAYKYLNHETVLKVLMDYGHEYFKISAFNVEKNYIRCVCRQVTYQDSLKLFLEDVRPTEKTSLDFMTYLQNNALGSKKDITFTSSGIGGNYTAYYIRKNLHEAFTNSENGILNLMTCEMRRRGYIIHIDSVIGKTTGIVIRDKKNLVKLVGTSTNDGLYTKIKGRAEGLEGNWKTSKYINDYKDIYHYVYYFSDIKLKSDTNTDGYTTAEEAIAEIDRRVQLKFDQEAVDLPDEKYTINFQQLSTKDMVEVGDKIKCVSEQLDSIITMRVVEREYDVCKQSIENITVCTKPKEYSNWR